MDWQGFYIDTEHHEAALVVADSPWVNVRLTEDMKLQTRLEDPDELQQTYTWHDLELSVRHTVSQWWTIRCMLHNPTNHPITVPDLVVNLDLGSDSAGWSWAAESQGLLVAAPSKDYGPIVAWSVTMGCMRRVGKKLIITPKDLVLNPGQRYISSWRGQRLPDVSAAKTLMPDWLPDHELRVNEEFILPQPKSALLIDGPAEVEEVMLGGKTGALVKAPPGELNIYLKTGANRMLLRPCWAPSLAEALYQTATMLLADCEHRVTGAEGLLLSTALSANLLTEPEKAKQRIAEILTAQTQQNWGPLDLAFVARYARYSGDLELAQKALEHALTLKVTLGYTQAALELWLSYLALGLPDPEKQLFRRDDVTKAGLVEWHLLRGQDFELREKLLAGLINSLGADLPGIPWNIGRVKRAKKIGLLNYCPENSKLARLAAATRKKTLRRLLAMMVNAEIKPKNVETLAWLVLSQYEQ